MARFWQEELPVVRGQLERPGPVDQHELCGGDGVRPQVQRFGGAVAQLRVRPLRQRGRLRGLVRGAGTREVQGVRSGAKDQGAAPFREVQGAGDHGRRLPFQGQHGKGLEPWEFGFRRVLDRRPGRCADLRRVPGRGQAGETGLPARR